jgi:hypothetical protein
MQLNSNFHALFLKVAHTLYSPYFFVNKKYFVNSMVIPKNINVILGMFYCFVNKGMTR